MEESKHCNDHLPGGWRFASLGEICVDPQYGWTTSADKNGRGIKLLRTTDISKGEVDWSTVPACEREPEDVRKYVLSPGDILVSRAGSVGISYVVKECPRAVFASYLIRFRPLPPVSSDYIGYFLKSPQYWDAIAEETAGIAIPNVNASKLKKLAIPIAPVEEQKRIVAKIEELLPKVNAVRERLIRVKEIMKRFRQSVLSAACSGRLTEGWRDSKTLSRKNRYNENCGVQNGSVNEESTPLPESWARKTVDKVCTEIVDCPHSTPKWAKDGKICVRTTNFRPGFLDLSEVRYVSKETFKKRTERLEPMPGDVLFSREGGILGIACIIPDGVKLCLGQRMMLLRTDSKRMRSSFLMHVLNSPEIQKVVTEFTGGSASPHLNVGEIKNFPVPVPSTTEQKEIVRRVESLFKLADKVEKRVEVELSRTEKMAQAILAKAFRGELVSTEVYLERGLKR